MATAKPKAAPKTEPDIHAMHEALRAVSPDYRAATDPEPETTGDVS